MKFGTLTFLTTEVLFGAPAIPVRLAAQTTSSEITIIGAPARAPAACKAQIRAKECRETRTLPAIS